MHALGASLNAASNRMHLKLDVLIPSLQLEVTLRKILTGKVATGATFSKESMEKVTGKTCCVFIAEVHAPARVHRPAACLASPTTTQLP
mmetsp:Transcript_21785/g.60369  ORF Transcript_21785/g.60369 Transcript_21785/m.60369 type:complete len:89 (+) Transcript_21785:90-356(+)|eukprot:1141901-Pelagomonas_calceolata.AAC.3